MGYGSNCSEREGTESAHPGNVTELAAVMRSRSFLEFNKSRDEMSCGMEAGRGRAPQVATVQCKSLNGDMMHENLHSSGAVQTVNSPRVLFSRLTFPAHSSPQPSANLSLRPQICGVS